MLTEKNSVMYSSYAILLYSSIDKLRISNILVLKAFLKSKNILFEEIDGADPIKLGIRNTLFEIAEQGGTRDYPMLFSLHKDQTITFVGNWEKIQDLLDAESIDAATLKQYPDIMTLSQYFVWNCLFKKQTTLS